MAQHNVCHVEFAVSDLKRSQDFYGGLFNWTFRSFGSEMVVFGLGDQHIGGLSKAQTISPGDSPSVWFRVEEIDPYLAKASRLGGGIRTEKKEVPGVGWSACLLDPDNNPVGIVQFTADQ